MSSCAPDNIGFYTTFTNITQIFRFWRQRYAIETFSNFDLPSRILTKDELTLIGDPLFWQGTSTDVSAALNRVLSLDKSFFLRVQYQISVMLRVWNVILEEKRSFDAYRADSNMPREVMEALLLCQSALT